MQNIVGKVTIYKNYLLFGLHKFLCFFKVEIINKSSNRHNLLRKFKVFYQCWKGIGAKI